MLGFLRSDMEERNREMARTARGALIPGVFHVASHGVGDGGIFLDEYDRVCFLRQLGSVVYRFRWICCSYCLMTNHFHLIVDTSAKDLTGGMHVLNSVYSRRFNARHRRSGRLVREHFMSEHIEDDYRFLNALKYIARNPVEAGICNHPGEWKWSSYNAIAGMIPAPTFLSVKPVLNLISQDERRARNTYVDFVSGCSLEVEREVKSRYYAGRAVTTCKVRERLRPTLAELFDGCDSIEARNRAIGNAFMVFGYTLKEIGEHVGLSQSTISRVGRLHNKINRS